MNKMNIEFETKRIIREGFNNEDKIRLIQRFANFSREDIIRGLNKRFDSHENLCSKIYLEIIGRNR
jgi:hypothetical protein